MIFVLLPLKQLLFTQRTCGTWYRTVTGSPKLQTALGLYINSRSIVRNPVDASTCQTVFTDGILHLTEVSLQEVVKPKDFRILFSIIYRYEDTSTLECLARVQLARGRNESMRSFALGIMFACRRERPDARDTFHHNDESTSPRSVTLGCCTWRRMSAVQSPVLCLILELINDFCYMRAFAKLPLETKKDLMNGMIIRNDSGVKVADVAKALEHLKEKFDKVIEQEELPIKRRLAFHAEVEKTISEGVTLGVDTGMDGAMKEFGPWNSAEIKQVKELWGCFWFRLLIPPENESK